MCAKIRYRRPDKSDYSTRQARSEAKKYILGMLADVIRDSAICGYEQTVISEERINALTENSTGRWKHGIRRQFDAAAMELMDEFRRRSDRP